MAMKCKSDAHKNLYPVFVNYTFVFIKSKFVRFLDKKTNYTIKIQTVQRNQRPLKYILITPPNMSVFIAYIQENKMENTCFMRN